MPVAIIVASVASAVSVPTEADLLVVKTNQGQLIEVLPSALKAKKSNENQVAIKVDKEIRYIDIEEIESMTVRTMDTYDATHHFLNKVGVEADVSELDDNVLRYYSTKRYKKGQVQKSLCIAACTIGVVAQSWFFAVAPLPYAQHKQTLKTYEQSDLMARDEYKKCNAEVKLAKKQEKAANKKAK